VREGSPLNVILLDLGLPGINGLDGLIKKEIAGRLSLSPHAVDICWVSTRRQFPLTTGG
jgi:hypothetical protein